MARPVFPEGSIKKYPAENLPEFILRMFGDQREMVERATTIRVERDEGRQTTRIRAYTTSQVCSLQIDDFSLLLEGFDTAPRTLSVELETFYSPYPILGWRQWIGSDEMSGAYGVRWNSPYMEAICQARCGGLEVGCGCGIYAYKDLAYLSLGDNHHTGLVVMENVVEYSYGYRAQKARCIAIDGSAFRITPIDFSTIDSPVTTLSDPVTDPWITVPIWNPSTLQTYKRYLDSHPEEIPPVCESTNDSSRSD